MSSKNSSSGTEKFDRVDSAVSIENELSVSGVHATTKAYAWLDPDKVIEEFKDIATHVFSEQFFSEKQVTYTGEDYAKFEIKIRRLIRDMNNERERSSKYCDENLELADQVASLRSSNNFLRKRNVELSKNRNASCTPAPTAPIILSSSSGDEDVSKENASLRRKLTKKTTKLNAVSLSYDKLRADYKKLKKKKLRMGDDPQMKPLTEQLRTTTLVLQHFTRQFTKIDGLTDFVDRKMFEARKRQEQMLSNSLRPFDFSSQVFPTTEKFTKLNKKSSQIKQTRKEGCSLNQFNEYHVLHKMKNIEKLKFSL